MSSRAIEGAKKGSAEVVILALLDDRSRHGYEIAGLIEERSDGTIRFTLASLYATLYRGTRTQRSRSATSGRWTSGCDRPQLNRVC